MHPVTDYILQQPLPLLLDLAIHSDYVLRLALGIQRIARTNELYRRVHCPSRTASCRRQENIRCFQNIYRIPTCSIVLKTPQ